MDILLDTTEIDELKEEIVMDSDTAGCKVEFVLSEEPVDYHGEEYLPVKFVITETHYHTEIDVFVTKKYKLKMQRGEYNLEDYSGALLWMMLYFERGNVAWREKDK